MLVVKVRKATQVLRVSLDRQEQKDCVVLTDLVDRLVLLDLLDLLDSLDLLALLGQLVPLALLVWLDLLEQSEILVLLV